ncbi:hypothetical protein RhiirB3_439054, partial [Rhizophagus irregularis]
IFGFLYKSFTPDLQQFPFPNYHFDYNIRNINPSKLAKLCAWPLDKNITLAIKHSYKLASELAKALDMDPTSNMNHSLLLPFVMIENQNLEVSNRIKSILELENDSNNEIEISDAISQASKYTTERIDDILNLSNIENIDDQIRQAQVISSLDNIRIINNELLTHGEQNYLGMIKLRKDHEAYNSRPIERQNHVHMIGHEITNTINPNKASHIISYLTNNGDLAMQFIK